MILFLIIYYSKGVQVEIQNIITFIPQIAIISNKIKMSLLNDLLFYSSVNGRQERSSSTFAKLQVQNYGGQQKKLERASKSLTKLSCWQASNSKLDPKQKIIYKIIHRLSVKLKKHYYLFFINLQFTANKKQQLPQKKLDKIKTGIIKLQQSVDFLFSKYYVTNSKDKYFLAIRQYGLKSFGIKKITNGFNQYKKRIFFQKLIQNYESCKNCQLKGQIFVDSIKNVENSFLLRNFCLFKQQLLLKVRAVDIKKPKAYIIENIVEEEYESCSQGIQTPKNLNSKIEIEILRHFQQITKMEQVRFDKQVQLQNNTKLINSFERRKNSKSRQKEEIIKKPILLNFWEQKKVNFIIQKPIIIRKNNESIPKQIIKIRYDIYQNSIPDLQDQSEIFRQPFSDYAFRKNPFEPTSETFRSYTQHQKESRFKTSFGQIFSINEENCPKVPKILQKCLTKRKLIPSYYGIDFNPQTINSQEGFFYKSSIKEPVCFKNSLIVERQNSEDCYQEKNGKWKKYQSQVEHQFLQKANHSKFRPTQQYRPLYPFIASNSFKKKSSSFSERQTSSNDRFYLHTIPLINMSGIVDNHKPVKDLQNYRNNTNYQTFLNSDKYFSQ